MLQTELEIVTFALCVMFVLLLLTRAMRPQMQRLVRCKTGMHYYAQMRDSQRV